MSYPIYSGCGCNCSCSPQSSSCGSGNNADLLTFSNLITQNTNSIQGNSTDITNLGNDLSSLTTQVTTNTNNIQINSTDITNLSGQVTINTTDISNLLTQVTNNTNAIANIGPTNILLNPTIWVDTANGNSSNTGFGGASDAVPDFATAAALTRNTPILGDITIVFRGVTQGIVIDDIDWNLPGRLIIEGDATNRLNSIIDYSFADDQHGLSVSGPSRVDIQNVHFRANYATQSGRFASAIWIEGGAVVFVLEQNDFYGDTHFNAPLFEARGAGSWLVFLGRGFNANNGDMNINIPTTSSAFVVATGGADVTFRNSKTRLLQDFNLRFPNSVDYPAFYADQNSIIQFTSFGGATFATSFNPGGEPGRFVGVAYRASQYGRVRRSVNITNTWTLTNTPDYTGIPVATVPGVVLTGGIFSDEVNNTVDRGNTVDLQLNGGTYTFTNADGSVVSWT